jgi:nucleoside transporter
MSTVAARTPSAVRFRLALMMFLQYFAQGAYLVIVFEYVSDGLGYSGYQAGLVLGGLSLGPLFAPFIIGQLVDRLLPTERVLAACHLLAGLLMILLYSQKSFVVVLLLATAYSVLYVPTVMLTNSLTFRHLADRDREFPMIRVWGTIGFIVPAWLILYYFLTGLEGQALYEGQRVAFAVSGVASLVMSVYCLTLPHTPPDPRSSGKFAPGVVLGLARRREFLVLFLVTFFLGIVHQYFFVFDTQLVRSVLARAGRADSAQAFTTICQIAEIGVMALLGLSLTRLGYKRTMLIGATAYTLRCVVLAFAGEPNQTFAVAVTLAGIGQALHGVCFGFFLAAAFVYVDRTAPPDVKGSMQTVFGTVIFGLGAVLGGFAGGPMKDRFTAKVGEEVHYQWMPIWLSCAALAAVCTLVLAIAFPPTPPKKAE